MQRGRLMATAGQTKTAYGLPSIFNNK